MAENILHDHEDHIPGGLTLIPSSGGIFEVQVGDDLVFSKDETGRFPEPDEAERLVGETLGAG